MDAHATQTAPPDALPSPLFDIAPAAAPPPVSNMTHRFALIACGAMMAASVCIGCLFYWLYDTSKQNILGSWRVEMQACAQKISHYIKMPMDAVAFSALYVNKMLGEAQPHASVLAYLTRETAIYASLIADNTTGVYAYYKGKYLDGSGWVPPPDYQPMERPWYMAAVHGDGATVLVKPYRNLQTKKMMTSVAQLLADGKSVISMDMFLDSIQRMVEAAVTNDVVKAAFVMDNSAFVVAHSNSSMVGKNLDTDGADYQKKLARLVSSMEDDHLEINAYEGKYTILVETINADWRAVFVLHEHELGASLVLIYVASGVFLFLVMAVIVMVFLSMSNKYAEAEQLSKEVLGVASIYTAVIRINLLDGSLSCMQGRETVDALLEGDYVGFHKRTAALADRMAAAQSRDLLRRFLDTTTLEERLQGVVSISQEFMSTQQRWMRLRFVVIDRDSWGALYHVLLALESIDEDRKRQESLRKLSETDLMTGIRNRGSGESRIRQAMAERRYGMFGLLDADKFKSINDTYGHAVGDKVIIAIAACMKRTFRESDTIFRLGGDEFAVFSEGVIKKNIAQRIWKRFFRNIDSIVIPEMGDRKICLSVGVTFYPATHEDSFEAMYQRADTCTYASKKIEGNAVTFNVPQED